MTFNGVYTIGYSGYHQDLPRFVTDLRHFGIKVNADVRSSPYSRYAEEFNRERFGDYLRKNGLLYLFMGDQLGARPTERSCYRDGAVDYDAIMTAAFFQKGLDRIQDGLTKGYVIALMCAEKDPIDCHRNILVAHALSKRGVQIRHLIQFVSGDSAVAEDQEDAEARLVDKCNKDSLAQGDLFLDNQELIERAYRSRFKEIAYKEENDDDNE